MPADRSLCIQTALIRRRQLAAVSELKCNSANGKCALTGKATFAEALAVSPRVRGFRTAGRRDRSGPYHAERDVLTYGPPNEDGDFQASKFEPREYLNSPWEDFMTTRTTISHRTFRQITAAVRKALE